MVSRALQKLKDAPVIYIDPVDAANAHSLNKRKPLADQPNWDKLGNSVFNSYIFKAFESRLSGESWESTELYKRRQGKKNKFPYWDKMLFDIVENGYTFKPFEEDSIDEYMSILVGRNGHLFIYNGIHRFCSCLLSKKPKKVPVKILYRHPEWEAFRNKCLNYAKRRKQLYCQLPHPDLDQIPHKWTNERAELIAQHSNHRGGNLIDIGAHWGTISYTLAQNNFNVLAVENKPAVIPQITKISKLPGKPFKITNQDFTRMNIKADTLVMLNIAHHFIVSSGCVKAGSINKKFVRFLDNLDVKEVFYQAHGRKSKWSRSLRPLAYLDLIKSRIKMTNVKEIKNFDGRILYQLT